MPQVGLAAPWGDTERGDERAARADSREALAPRRSDRALAASVDFDFAAARAASAARRRSGSARQAAHFAEPVIEVDVPAAPPARGRADAIEPRRRSRRLEAVREAREPRPEPVVEAPPRLSADGRRIVTITGRGSERYAPVVQRRRPSQRPYEREGFQPDRAAMWAVLLGVLMILAAATSAHAAVLVHHAAAHTLAALGAR